MCHARPVRDWCIVLTKLTAATIVTALLIVVIQLIHAGLTARTKAILSRDYADAVARFSESSPEDRLGAAFEAYIAKMDYERYQGGPVPSESE